ncbi:MAG: polyphosphate kinase 2 [Candidatus Thiodiazotropha taylori]|nr:polyphosphate kinase 2 [Candidatus Thiodiazotropha taylori]
MTNDLKSNPIDLEGGMSSTPLLAPPSGDTPDSEEDKTLAMDSPTSLTAEIEALKEEISRSKNDNRPAIRRYRNERELKPYQAELIKMQQCLEDHNKRMAILFEGRSAAGKGGAIRRITRYMNKKHYRIVALGKPNDEERSQWYFQRYISRLPRAGEVVLFDTSWYSRAMVEPVLGFCTAKEYRDFIKGVIGFENDMVRQHTILVKLYFSISRKEQQKRFDRRRIDPLRQWKLDEADIQIQEKRDEFTKMKYRMLRRTHTHFAPWTIIRSDNKHLARLNAIKAILNAVPYERVDTSLDLTTDPSVVISGAREQEIMQAQLLRNGCLEV